MKAMEKLVRFYEENKNKGKNACQIGPFKEKKLGNHRVEIYGDGHANFIYYWTPICKVDTTGKVTITNGGWGTSSTTRACNSYNNEFCARGYSVEDIR